MPVTKVGSRWASGSLIFHEKGNLGDAANLLTLSTTEVTIGNSAQDVDLKIYLGAADQYVLFDAGAATVTFAKVDVAISADVTVTVEDISIAQGKFLYLDGQSGGEYLYSKTADYANLNGTTGIDFMIGGTEEVSLVANSLQPYANDGCALGTGALSWSDLFLASAGVINFANGDVTITHGSHSLTFDACGVVFNEASADYDWRAETNNMAYALYADGGKDSIVIGSNTDTSSADQLVNVTRAARTATANVAYYDLKVTPAGAVTVPTGTTALVATARIDEPNITATGTVTEAATLYVTAAPTEGGVNYALHVAGGKSMFSGDVDLGIDATGVDVTFFGDTTLYKVWWDQNGDTNGAWYFGADAKGVMTYWYGDTASYNVHFDPSGDTNGAWYFGANDYGIDVALYGQTAGASLTWDASADKLVGAGPAFVQIGESTTGVNSATPTAMIYGYYYGKTTAVTGTGYGLRGNAVVHVASTGGTAIGAFGRAANGKSTTDTDGVNLGTARGGSFLVAGVGLGDGGPAVISAAQGVYVQLDINAANLTITDARGIYVNVQSGNEASNTLSACNLAYLEYECVTGTAPAINSAIKIATVGGMGANGIQNLIDSSTATQVAYGTGKQVVLMKFKGANGTTYYLIHDTDSATVTGVVTTVS